MDKPVLEIGAFNPENLKLAKASCRHCHGTGIYGTLLQGEKRVALVCKCVALALRRSATKEEKTP